MIPYVLPLADPRADLAAAGGKGMSLARMIQAGLPVPGGFHVTTEAYRLFVSENELQPRILDALKAADVADPASLEAASLAIGRLFTDGEIPAPVVEAVGAAYANTGGAPVAVRSSATAEDLPGASFAGQQETYLNIRGTEAVLEAVKRCWASLWTARAVAYRIKNQIDHGEVALAVVVQELVNADAAGILFTANPVNGSRSEMVINAAWGLGEAVVSGAVTPDTITVDKATGKALRREIAEKQVMTVRTEAGTHEVPVPDVLRKKTVLTGAQTAELAKLGVRIEQLYEMPMDVEWALSGGKFAILQARPITALPVEWKVPVKKAVYARGSLAEHIPNPVTPLFATLGLEIANEATEQMWRRMLGDSAQLVRAGSGFYELLNGYVYGGARMDAKAMLTMLKMTVRQLGPVLRGSVARWKSARAEFAGVVESWEQKPIEQFSAAELLEGVRAVFGAACRYFTMIQTTLPAASSSEIMFTRFYNSLIRRDGDPEANIFLLGFETVGVRSEKSLYDLSRWLKERPALADYVLQTPSDRLAEDLSRENPPEHLPAGLPADLWCEWRERFQAHLKTFGRTTYEFDFSNPTPMEMPVLLLDAVKSFLTGIAHNPHERQREAVEKREQATRTVLQRTGWPRRGLFEKLLRWAQETGPVREDSIFDMGMGHPLIRRMFGELGRRFVQGGAIESVDEIYWLEKQEVEELAALLDAGKPLPAMSGRIPERKAEWQAQLKLSPPVMLPERSGWNKVIHGAEAERRDGKIVLKGVGTSGGVVTAPACVVYDPEDFGKFKPGDVLVAVTTTPAWTPLFAMASAVVTDIGGPLSHSSIVAREYGIPAVMSARTATHDIQTGQIITVDGSAGTITIEG